MKKEVNLNQLSLDKIGVHVDLKFLAGLLKSAAGEKPENNLIFAKKLGLSINSDLGKAISIKNWKYGTRTVPLEKLIKISRIAKCPWSSVQSNIKSLGCERGCVFPALPIKIGYQLGSVIGHILGDGSIDSRYNQVFFSNSNKDLLYEFEKNMKDIFGIEPRIWMQERPSFGHTKWEKRLRFIDELEAGKNCGLFYPSVCGKILNGIFGNFSIGNNKKITNEISNSNKEFKKGLIRAFYDDECSVGKKNIRLFQDRKDILEFFREMLLHFRIQTSEVKSYIKREKVHYYFDIFRKSNFKNFKNEIGFTSLVKMKKLNILCLIKNSKNAK
ncbi:MAG: LAGLIDADG family homing endonuclease [Nanoarchaeota archaeon]|nr:LAGLIDADG family homing endonuclease [Nanoarchaeota archaeon]